LAVKHTILGKPSYDALLIYILETRDINYSLENY